MPWQGSKRFAYEFLSILEHAPMQSGVFITVARDECVYVGEADNICGQLLLHLESDDHCMARHRPTHFAFELVAPKDREARHQELIQEFLPACNAGQIIVTYSRAWWSPQEAGCRGS
jgi:hypothetical protein